MGHKKIRITRSVVFLGTFLVSAFFISFRPLVLQVNQKWTTSTRDGYVLVMNPSGSTLGYTEQSGVKILTVDGFGFKDLNKNGQLDKYEDWRLPVEIRAKDLASKMSVEQIAGLMLYSRHQAIPSLPGPMGQTTYNNKSFKESGANSWDLSDQQKSFLTRDNLRHVLITSVQSPEVAARWNNGMQAMVEGIGLGIPTNNSTDPRNSTNSGVEYTAGAGGKISQWPEPLGLAATFDPMIVLQFGQIAAKEYRALGITTALSPQIDLGTEPRWSRINGTFGEDPQLDADMARAYVDGFQNSIGSNEISDGWGYTSVNAMIKHWPGGGPEEGGRDAHFAYGKFAVYPGNNFDEQVVPFVDGALRLTGKTKMAAAVMPYYTISYNMDGKNGENKGNSYNAYLITDLLRNKYAYDGVICTDWLVTADEGKSPDIFAGKSWGMESNTIAERHYKILMAGVDQFGGNNDAGPVLEAYQMGVKEHGEAFMRARMETSAVRLLRNFFRVGLFENPYLDTDNTIKTVGKPSFMKSGYEAQLKSVVMLKNTKHQMPVQKEAIVYVPKQYVAERKDFFGNSTPAQKVDPVSKELLAKYFNVTEDPEEADFAIVFMAGPSGGPGYDKEDLTKGGNGYVPISLQYTSYTAEYARAKSIAAGDPVEPGITNRSYKGKTVRSAFEENLTILRETKKALGVKPVIVCMALNKPAIVSEFEKDADGILVSFGVQNQALLDIISGTAEPSGLLPLQMPADMKNVELQHEDVPHDMICYTDANKNTYNFGFGMDWKGVISDSRTAMYANIIKRPEIKVSANRVTITCPTPGAKIYYTIDGSTPAFIKENEYTQPFTVNKGTVIRVFAKKFGVDNSSLVEYVNK
jgi:beta-glucosidase